MYKGLEVRSKEISTRETRRDDVLERPMDTRLLGDVSGEERTNVQLVAVPAYTASLEDFLASRLLV